VDVMAGHSASEDAPDHAYDPAIHLPGEGLFSQRGWMRGSSPRMTAREKNAMGKR